MSVEKVFTPYGWDLKFDGILHKRCFNCNKWFEFDEETRLGVCNHCGPPPSYPHPKRKIKRKATTRRPRIEFDELTERQKKYRKLTDEQIVNLYNYGEGLSTIEISKKANITREAILDVLYKYKIPITTRPGNRKHNLDEDFFKEWSNEMAWLLGFIYADGCMSENKYGYSLSISQKDKEILEKINSVLQSDYAIHTGKNNNGKHELSTLVIHNKTLCNDLFELGVTPRKSLTIQFPNVPKEYTPHFIRGVLDGDGWVHKKGYTLNITTGSKEFADGLCQAINELGVVSEVKPEKKYYRVWVRGKENILNFADIIYKNSSDLFHQYKKERCFYHKGKIKK